MLLEVGPVSSTAVVAWIDHAEAVLAHASVEEVDLEATPFDDHVPDDVYDLFAGYLRDWRPIAESTEVFTWSLEVEPEVAEYLVHAFFKLSWRTTRSSKERSHMPAEAAVFNRHLVKRMLAALSGEGTAEAEFAEHLRSFWPGLDA